jgi:hypothetical protein
LRTGKRATEKAGTIAPQMQVRLSSGKAFGVSFVRANSHRPFWEPVRHTSPLIKGDPGWASPSNIHGLTFGQKKIQKEEYAKLHIFKANSETVHG